MKIIRKIEIDTNEYKIGHQIAIELKNIGNFTATLQKIDSNKLIFMFDDCPFKKSMNDSWTNKGGYKDSKMRQFIDNEFISLIPEELRDKIQKITLPTYGQIFSHDDFYENYISKDSDEQFELMKNEKNRVSTYKGETVSYWLQNAVRSVVSSNDFANVTNYGGAYGNCANYSFGVRPVFILVR